MSKFRPSLALSIATGLGLAVLFALGTWQAMKIGPKENRIKTIRENFKLPAVKIAELSVDIENHQFRHIVWSGRIVGSQPLRHFLTNSKGKSGYHLYWPVQHENKSVLMVNFGWVPFDYNIDKIIWSKGNVKLQGYLRNSATATSFQPANDPVNNSWYVANVPEMCAAIKVEDAQCINSRLILDDKQGNKFPLKDQMAIELPNKHREYAFTWFGISGALIGVFIAFGLQRGRELAQDNAQENNK